MDSDEKIYLNHYFFIFSRFDFENPINEIAIPYIMSREIFYLFKEVNCNIKMITYIKYFSNYFSFFFRRANSSFFSKISAFTIFKSLLNILISFLSPEISLSFINIFFSKIDN